MKFSLKDMIVNGAHKVRAKVGPKMPDILMGIGTAGVVGGTVMACRATTNVPGIMKDYRDQKAQIQTGLDEDGDHRTDEEMAKDIRRLKVRTVGKLALNYASSAAVEGLSLAGMWGGYGQMKTMFLEASATCVTLTETIRKCREFVRNEYGEDAEEKMMHNYREEEVLSTNENGETVTEKVKIYPRDHHKMPSPYARYFCYGEATSAEKSLDYNVTFLNCLEPILTRRLKALKKIALNDVYDELGIKRSITGNRVGWIYDEKSPTGDNEVKLRARIVFRETVDDFGNPNGWERVIMIDPNVDGAMEKRAVQLGLMDE
jgi:hypothetical protein